MWGIMINEYLVLCGVAIMYSFVDGKQTAFLWLFKTEWIYVSLIKRFEG